MGQWLGKELAVLCGLVLLVAGGYLQGRQTGRWESPPTPRVIDFSSIPHELDGWSSTEFNLDQKDLSVGGIDGYFARNYEHQATGEVITVLILTGAGGPISVHPPEVCFAGRGYRNESKTVQVSLPSADGANQHQFDLAVFRGPESTEGHRAQLLWAWTSTGKWSVPSNPRLAFARLPRVYKMYVSRSLGPNHDRQDVDLSLNLLRQLTPEIEREFSTSEPVADCRERGFSVPDVPDSSLASRVVGAARAVLRTPCGTSLQQSRGPNATGSRRIVSRMRCGLFGGTVS